MNSFLPVGSVITKKDDEHKNRKYVILGYFPTTNEEKPKVFDYLCFLYPEGAKNKEYFYINDDEIDDLYYVGYQSKHNEILLRFLKDQSLVLKNTNDINNASLEMVLKFYERYGKGDKNA